MNLTDFAWSALCRTVAGLVYTAALCPIRNIAFESDDVQLMLSVCLHLVFGLVVLLFAPPIVQDAIDDAFRTRRSG